MSEHKCIDEMNKRLAPRNVKIATAISYEHDTEKLDVEYLVTTEKLDDKVRSKKVPLVIMTFCPFCGIRLKEVAK